MNYKYKTHGTCSQYIIFDIDDHEKIHNVKFINGCNGNLQGIGRLVEGQDAREIANKIKGIRCGFKQTSCPDQFAHAIEEALQEQEASNRTLAQNGTPILLP